LGGLIKGGIMKDFFDKIKQNVNKTITNISIKSKETIKSTQVKGQIRILQEQKKNALEELGNIVYIMYLKNSLNMERIKERCEKIKELDSQIKEKEEELKQIHLKTEEALGKPKVIKICECGAEIYESAKFCGKCGKKVEVEKEAVAEKTCSRCGASISSEDRFCPNCGEKVL
jgi:NADH pyrophosphatase NudC (nudix superfamily)